MALTFSPLLLYYIFLSAKFEPVLGILAGVFAGILIALKRH